MRNPYLKKMNTFMALHWKDTLEANGFFALRDFTEWVRVVNRNVMQIILCSGYTLPEILFYSQTLSEYMWCNYRNQTDMTSYSLNFYRNASAQYDENCRYICTNNDLNMQLQYTIETLNTIHTAQDIIPMKENSFFIGGLAFGMMLVIWMACGKPWRMSSALLPITFREMFLRKS